MDDDILAFEQELGVARRPFIRSAFNYDRDGASMRSGLVCNGPGRTKQEFAEEVDINTLLRRFSITGEMPTGVRMPTYEDFSGVSDYHSAVNAIAEAREAFDTMPAEVRRRFENDPQLFVEFCSNRENLAEARKLGLVPAAEVVETPAPVPAEPKASTGGEPVVP